MELTDAARNHDSDAGYLHDCISAPSTRITYVEPYQNIPYCFTEVVTQKDAAVVDSGEMFTFAQLEQQRINSDQLHQWSAPIDVVERYQSYLNEKSSTHASTQLGQQLYYNCTLPWFGPQCQYSLDIYQPDYPSLPELIADFYRQVYKPTEMTCYTHLKCVHANKWTCLDWSDVCDGIVDCKNGVDEAICSSLLFSRCEDNEWRCDNGQCIPLMFWRDHMEAFECLDGSDERRFSLDSASLRAGLSDYSSSEPTLSNEDKMCSRVDIVTTSASSSSSCSTVRENTFEHSLFLEKPNMVSEICWQTVTCSLLQYTPHISCDEICPNITCDELVNDVCIDMWSIPASTLAFGHMFFLYTREAFLNHHHHFLPVAPTYICYDDQLCVGPDPNIPFVSFNNATCRRTGDFPGYQINMAWPPGRWYTTYVLPLFQRSHQCNKISFNNTIQCDPLSMHQCVNSSKCIPHARICDFQDDCPYHDDELCLPINNSCTRYEAVRLIHCVISGLCVSAALVDGYSCYCYIEQYNYCEHSDFDVQMIRKQVSFQTICDGYIELVPVLIDNQKETDETECEYWECNNIYTHCDGYWNCPDGADEINCPLPWSSIYCSAEQHVCISPITFDFMCLPIEKANDGVPDCLGGMDEPGLCRATNYNPHYGNFFCISSKGDCVGHYLDCSGYNSTEGIGSKLCADDEIRSNHTGPRYQNDSANGLIAMNLLCTRKPDLDKAQRVYFALQTRATSSRSDRVQDIVELNAQNRAEEDIFDSYQQTCHRGLVVHLWSNTTDNSSSAIKCMCPPSYYGDRCQYQNQRVSLTMRLEALSIYRRTPFVLVIALIDDSTERTVHSYRQLNFLYIHDCKRKFNLYLVFSTRPKNATRHYFIHIDAFERISLAYRGSLLIPIQHSFMPVNRIAVHLDIIRSFIVQKSCLDRACQHGECVQYANSANQVAFCRCHEGWSGKYCHLQHRCTCSSGSICAGVSADNRSICICPLNKWGPRCFLTSLACQTEHNDICHGRGQCVPNGQSDDGSEPFTCLCRRGFSDERCEIEDNSLTLSFHRDIDIPQTILFHFVQVSDDAAPEIGTTFKSVLTDQNTISVSWSYPWHLAFLDLLQQNYYLITVQTVYNRSTAIARMISPFDRCPHVRELLNKSLALLPLLRRIKYYHLACRDSPVHLSCFFDEVQLCLCQDYDQRRLANCFDFNHTVQRDCSGQSYCENGAQCLQDRFTCPQLSVCVCPQCFYGVQCQFSSSGFDLSLDGILGYHIRPHVSLTQQPTLVKVSVALTMIILIGGVINGILSAITFFQNDSRKTGSGIYLLISSLNIVFTMGAFGLKYWILVAAQISYTTNRSFLFGQCLSLDFLVKVGLSLDQWLSACVSTERALAATRGSKFDQKSSKRTARYVIASLILIITGSTIQDPIHRRLLEENGDNVDQERIWCIVQYSTTLRRYNSAILMLQFIVPIVINLFATVVIIVKTTQQRMRAQRNQRQTYQQILREQVQQLRHLLIAPAVFIALAIPRLIISFTSGCMKSGGTVWVFLIGYLISFVPSTFTFLVFVYPSKSYRQIFQATIRHNWKTVIALLRRPT